MDWRLSDTWTVAGTSVNLTGEVRRRVHDLKFMWGICGDEGGQCIGCKERVRLCAELLRPGGGHSRGLHVPLCEWCAQRFLPDEEFRLAVAAQLNLQVQEPVP